MTILQQFVGYPCKGLSQQQRLILRNIVDHQTTVDMPGLHGRNITVCATISKNGIINHFLTTGPQNANHLLDFVGGFYNVFIPENKMSCQV